MGFFSKISKEFKKATGVSFLPFNVLSSVEGFINDPTGAKEAGQKQVAALRSAGKIEEAQRLEAQLLRSEILASTAPFREQALTELEKLRTQEPGGTQFFKQGLERGTTALAEKAAGFGLLDSGGTIQQFGELGANLLTQEELIRQQGLSRLAGLSQVGFQPALGALGQESGAAFRQAQTQANIGAIQAAGAGANKRFFGGLATQLGGFALGGYLGGLAGAPPGVGSTLSGARAAGAAALNPNILPPTFNPGSLPF